MKKWTFTFRARIQEAVGICCSLVAEEGPLVFGGAIALIF